VADQLLEADIVAHLKRLLSADDAVVELLYNSLMLVKSVSTTGEFYVGSPLCINYLWMTA